MSDYPGMVDAIPQIRQALASLDTTLPYTVSEQWPRTSITGNLITVTEITNASTSWRCVDDLAYQIDVWAAEADAVRELAPLVNDALLGIGFRRTASQPLDRYDKNGGYFRKALRFGRKVDKRFMRLID
jgi:hypothetical protein